MSTPTPPDAESSALLATALPAADKNAASEPEYGERWGTFPAPERRSELDARLAEWAAMADHSTLLGPFDREGWHDGLSGADVYYLAARSLVGSDGDIANGLAKLREPLMPLPDLPDLHLEHADLRRAQLEHADLRGAHLEHANLSVARLKHADLRRAQLEHANLIWAQLEHATLFVARLEHADLGMAHLEHAILSEAHLAGADLRGAFFDAGTGLASVVVSDAEHGGIRVADVRWQGVNLAVVTQWLPDMVLGDEQEAWKLARAPLPATKAREQRREVVEQRRNEVRAAFREAARANRQLATVMRDQGMNDEADHFAYRAQVMQRQLYRQRGKPFRAGFSRFLDLIAGYGYKPERSVIAYLLVIVTFAAAYFALSHLVVGPPFSPYSAAVFSMTSFHGRGFFPGGISLDDPITGLAALEALCGLIIEVSFIATFTQRFFGK